MNRTTYYLLTGLLPLLMACSADGAQTADSTEGVPISVQASVGSMQSTRTSTTLQSSGSFDSGEEVRLFITDNTNTKTYHTEGYHYTPSADRWTEGQPYYPVSQKGSITIYGVYPASITSSPHDITVGDQQYTDDNTASYTRYDVMYASKTTDRTPSAVSLGFSHLMSKVNVIVKAESSEYEWMFEKANITLHDVNYMATFTFDKNSGSVTTDETDRTDIKLTQAKGDGLTPSSAILPPQTLKKRTAASDKALLEVGLPGTAKTFVYRPTADIKLEAGYEYTFTLTIGLTQIINITTDITDWGTKDKTGTTNTSVPEDKQIN